MDNLAYKISGPVWDGTTRKLGKEPKQVFLHGDIPQKGRRHAIVSETASQFILSGGVYYFQTIISNLSVINDKINDIQMKMDAQVLRSNVITTKIYGLPSENYELKAPIDVIIEISEDEVLAIIPDLELYGEGINQIEAINDLKIELIELFEELDGIPDNKLGNEPKSWKKILDLMIKKCQ